VLAPHGVEPAVLEIRLVPPVLGGDDWVRRHGGGGAPLLPVRAAQGPVAALLHGSRGLVAAVVADAGAALHAYGRAFATGGEPLDVDALSDAVVVEAVPAPFAGVAALARRLGWDEALWRAIRAWRRRAAEGGLHAAH